MSQFERAALLGNDDGTPSGGQASPTSSTTAVRRHAAVFSPANDADLGSSLQQNYQQQRQQQPNYQHHHGSAHHQHQQLAASSSSAMAFSSEEDEEEDADDSINSSAHHQRSVTTIAAAAAAATSNIVAEWSSGSYTSTSNSHSSTSSRYENGDSHDDDDDDEDDEDDDDSHHPHRNRNRHNNDSDTDSYIPDWEPFVQSDGSLFYVEYDCQPVAQQQVSNPPAAAVPSSASTTKTSSATAASSSSLLNRAATRRSSNTNLGAAGGGGSSSTAGNNSKRGPLSSKLSTLMHRNLRLGLGAVVSRPNAATNSSTGKDGSNGSTINASAPSTSASSAAHATANSSGPTMAGATSVKFSEIPEGEVKQLRCILDPSQRHKFGRRASVAEALLGISVSPFQDGNRLMIAGYMPALPATTGAEMATTTTPSVGLTGQQERRYAKVGDWLKAIDGREVNAANLDAILLAYAVRTEVLVTLQRMSGEAPAAAAAVSAMTNASDAAAQRGPAGVGAAASSAAAAAAAQLSLNRVCNWAEMASNAQQIMRAEALIDEEESAAEKPQSGVMVLSVMYLTLKELAETASSDGQDDVLFCYPEREQNPLFAMRGSFLTLNSLLLDEMCNSSSSGVGGNIGSSSNATNISSSDNSGGFGSGAQLTSIEVPPYGRYHVVYWAVDAPADRRSGGSDVLLVALSAAHSTREAARARAAELAQCMQFVHQKQTLALTNPANHARWTHVCRMVALLVRYAPHAEQLQRRFEAQLPQSEWLPLPKDAQMRIDDALGEMEAMDYREWNGRPLQSHREFYVIGSAVWWAGWLLGTHLPPADLLDVERFLRVHGVLRMLSVRGVREMLVWQEVYPASVERGLVQQNYAYGIPQGRWFLACVARGQMLLAVLLEARHDSDLLVPHITPAPFYMEEMQDTFELLKAGGIETIAEAWMRCNKRPQVLTAAAPVAAIAATEAATAGVAAVSAISGQQQQQQQPIVAKKAEIISILKRRNNSAENVGLSAAEESGKLLLSLPHSAATSQQAQQDQQQHRGGGGSSSVHSQTFSEDSNHEDSDSDWDGFPDSQRSSSGYDLSEGAGAEHLLRDVSDVLPGK